LIEVRDNREKYVVSFDAVGVEIREGIKQINVMDFDQIL
jgi:hypothetical protein